MKTNTTLSLDGEIKDQAIRICYSNGTSLSQEVNKFIKKIVEQEDKKNARTKPQGD